MRKQIWAILISILLVCSVSGPAAATGYDATETEPNNEPATANTLYSDANMHGVATGSDVDVFRIGAPSPTWAAIVLLEATPPGSLTVELLASDGATVLATDQHGWAQGAAIAVQPFADSQPHYVRVQPAPGHPQGGSYVLRSAKTFGFTMPEQEPNDNLGSAQSAPVVAGGSIDPAADADVYAFDGQQGQEYILALNGDPERDGVGGDLLLEWLDASGQVLATANQPGDQGDEVILIPALPADGLYYVRVRQPAGNGDPTTTYWLAVSRDRGIYAPRFDIIVSWENPRTDWPELGDYARVGDALDFVVGIENTSLVDLPGAMRISSSYNRSASRDTFGFVSAQAPFAGPTAFLYYDQVRWPDIATALPPGQSYLRTITLRAMTPNLDAVDAGIGLDYFVRGTAQSVPVRVINTIQLPNLLR